MRTLFVCLVALLVGGASGPAWDLQSSGTGERLRAVSAVSASIAWASGNRGTVIRTTDGGATWQRLAIPGTDMLDFRDVEAIDARTAFVLSIGTGDRSRIYRTTDGGVTWTPSFTNADPKAFYDAIAFWDGRCGLAVGDPVDGRFLVLRTTDGGDTWTLVPQESRPPALSGDGMFAASGTCLVVHGRDDAFMGTGGAARARILRSADRGLTWAEADTPIAAGNASSGIFSIAFADASTGMIVGGDYRKEQEPSDNHARSSDGGRTWTAATRLRAFRSGVVFVPGSRGRQVIAVGPAGTDLSTDGGASWTPIGELGFHAVGIDRSGSGVWAVGEHGRVARLTGLVVAR